MSRNDAVSHRIARSSGSTAGRLALILLVAATLPACQDPVSPERSGRGLAAIAAPPPVPYAISDLGWGAGALVSHFALDVNDSSAIAGASYDASLVLRAVRAPNRSSRPIVVQAGASDAVANAISPAGMVTGHVAIGSSNHAFVHDPRTNRSYVLATNASSGLDINRGGRAVGWMIPTGGTLERAGYWSVGSSSVALIAPLAGGRWNIATSLSDASQIVGYSEVAGGAYHAFSRAWSSGALTDLGTLAGGRSSVAWSITDTRATPIIVGYSDDSQGRIRAVKWEGGVISDLGDLGGGNAVALDVNDAGDIVGYSMNAQGSWRPFLFRVGATQMEDLGVLDRGTFGVAVAISNEATPTVVGYVEDPNSVDRTRAVVWRMP